MSATGPQINPGELVPGTKYQVVKSLGAGGMGIVYQVVKPPNIGGVLKLMSTELTAHQEHRMRFFDEVRILAQLEHPNIVRVFDYDALPDGTPFYVMELLNGRTVRDVIATMGRVPPRVAYEVTRQLLEALQCAHTHDVPVIHRDIKPENIFLHAPRHGEPVVKLIDFGVSSVADRKHDGSFVGTWSYAAPEQIRGEKPTAATDLYAAGLVLYEMLAGRGPFDHHDDWTKISEAQIKEIPAPVSTFAPWVPASIVALISSALAKDPRQRPRDAYAFAERLFELEWASDGKDPHDLTVEGPSAPIPGASAPPNVEGPRPAAGRAFTPRRARPDTPPIELGGKGPLSRVLSTVTTQERGDLSSKNLAAASPAADRLGDVPLIGVPPESVRSGPTWKGVGEQTNNRPVPRHEPTSPDANALLAGLGAEPRKPPSKRERESDPDVSPRAGQVVIRAGRHPSEPHEGQSPTTPRAAQAAPPAYGAGRGVNALSGIVTHEEDRGSSLPANAAAQQQPNHRDTFSSQQSDPRGTPVRSKLPLVLIAAALLLSGLTIATIVVVRGRSTHVSNATSSAPPSSVVTAIATMTTTTATTTATTTTTTTTSAIVAEPAPVPTPSSVKAPHPSTRPPTTAAATKNNSASSTTTTPPAPTPKAQPASSSERPDFIRGMTP